MKGGSNKAAQQAQAAEDARQAAIKSTQGRINDVFNDPNRAADIASTVEAARQYGQRDLDTQKSDADRDLKFALARNGVIGGSTQNDQQEVVGDQYAKGLLDVQRKSLGVGSDLESADQDARARLISLATSGLDETTAAQQSAAALKSNLDGAKSASAFGAASDFFGQTKKFADAARDAEQRRKAQYDGNYYLNNTGYGQ